MIPAGLRSTSLVQDMVEEMSRRYRECFGEVFRFQVMNGTLWVDHISERHQGWYPSKLGAGVHPALPSAAACWLPTTC